jgi:hypothetical protein
VEYDEGGKVVRDMSYADSLNAYLARIIASYEAEDQARLAKVRAELQALA